MNDLISKMPKHDKLWCCSVQEARKSPQREQETGREDKKVELLIFNETDESGKKS